MAGTEPGSKPISELMSEIDSISNRYDAYGFLRRLAADRRYCYFGIVDVPPETGRQFADYLDVTNFSEAFLRSYDGAELFADDPVFGLLRRTVRPLAWTAQMASVRRNPANSAKAREILGDNGVINGILLPVHDWAGHRAALSLCGDRTAPEPEEVAVLSLVATCLYERLRRDRGDAACDMVKLSSRERQCLVWTAAGKTSVEIGSILGLSEHTVSQYITGACQKLGTVNRAQAVATAIRLKIIE